MPVAVCSFSKAAIDRHLKNPDITMIRDPRYPLLLYLHKNRSFGTWYFVTHKGGKTQRERLGTWPLLGLDTVVGQLPQLQADQLNQLAVTCDEWLTVGDLLRWYRDRALSNRTLSIKRKRNIKSSINKHLLPCLKHIHISDVQPSVLDGELIWPLQNRYQPGTVRQHFSLLKHAFKQARTLKLLRHNPLADVSFSDFIDPKTIQAREGRLKGADLSMLWQQLLVAPAQAHLLVVLMLAHGTRIGETRQLCWEHFDFDNGLLHIPAAITKTHEPLTLPLTPWITEFLERHKKRQARLSYSGGYLFQCSGRAGAVGESKASDWVKRVSQGRWTAHDLRKLARQSWDRLGVDYLVAERLLNHRLSRLNQAYINKYIDEQKRRALLQWHAELDQIKQQVGADNRPIIADNAKPKNPLQH